MPRVKPRLSLVLLAGAALAVPAALGFAPVSPANAKKAKAVSTVQAISAADRKQGADAHPQLLAEFGGAVSGSQADYVIGVGKTISIQSGLSNARDDFTVTLLNSSINNAFAIPGGYVYVTRQLVGLMNNEAELAGVLGHEVGHVAARHSAKRQAQAQQNAIIGVLGQILSGVVFGDSALGQIGQKISSTVPQLATLRYSRAQELQADDLGIQYLKRAGYDPRAMATVLQNLAAQNSLDAQLQGQSAKMPEWASTHPDPASRVRTALTKAGNGTGNLNRDTFLGKINGIMYGDDPQQGSIEGQTFTHPVFRFAFAVPAGYVMSNGTRAVSVSGQGGKGELTSAAYSGDLDAYIRAAFNAIAGQGKSLAPSSIEKTTVNGIPAAYGVARVTSGNSQVDVVVFAYEFAKDRAFHFAAITPAGQSNVFSSMFQSMRRINAADAAAVKARRVEVVTVKSGDTVASLANRMAFTNSQEARFRVLNGLAASDTVPAGQKVKIVVQSVS